MKPYYSEGGITIYHGDCREILPQVPKADLVLTDPPYGIGRDGMRPSTGSHGGRKAYEYRGWDKRAPGCDIFGLIFSSAHSQIIWGGNYFTPCLPPSMGWLVWDKGQRICGSDAELAYTSFDKALRVYTLNRVAIATDGAEHPTQKPVRLMAWCLKFAPDTKTVIDPFMGSGSTLVACKELGVSAVGIELEERYCEIAVRRLRQDVLPFADVDSETGPRSDDWMRLLGWQDEIKEQAHAIGEPNV